MIDPVQSIRIAANLAERFKALVKPPNALTGSTVAELELRIGEAQQTYPEIWRHLDDAHKELVVRGVDVSAFDELRRGELATLGVTDIDSRTEINYIALMAGRLRYTQVKTATFNVAGYQRAVAACKALMSAMPEVDWVALAKAEDQEIRAAGSLQTGVWIGIAKWVAIAGVLGGAAYGAHALFTRGGDPDVKAAREKAQADEHENLVLREQVARRHSDLIAAREQFYDSCTDLDRANYVRTLEMDSQLSEAAKVKTETCRPKPPRCGEGRDNAQARIIQKFDLVDDSSSDDYVWRCAGGFFGPANPGLVVALTDKSNKAKKVTVRGVVQRDGEADIIPLATWPHEISAIDAGDLDADGTDEIVTVYAQGVTVSRLRNGTLVDVADIPVLGIEPTGHACTGSIELLPDDEKPRGSRLAITIDDGAQGKGCPKPGYHSFVLQGDKLVDAAPPE
jgi:hypothetical protein